MKKADLKKLIKETILEVKKEEFIDFTKKFTEDLKKEVVVLRKMMKQDGFDL
jgi:hypothetical protein